MLESYKTIAGNYQHEIVIRGSRFICTLARTETEEDAEQDAETEEETTEEDAA